MRFENQEITAVYEKFGLFAHKIVNITIFAKKQFYPRGIFKIYNLCEFYGFLLKNGNSSLQKASKMAIFDPRLEHFFGKVLGVFIDSFGHCVGR